jgi:hypothetical protein
MRERERGRRKEKKKQRYEGKKTSQEEKKADRQKGHTRSTPKDAKKKKKQRPPGTLGHLLITKLQDLQDAVLVKCIPCGVKES